MEIFNLIPAHPILNIVLLGILFGLGFSVFNGK